MLDRERVSEGSMPDPADRRRGAQARALPLEGGVSAPRPERPAKERPTGFAIELLIVLVQVLVVATLVRTFAVQSFSIPSGSLTPTLLTGDYVVVSKYAYGYSKHAFPFGLINFEGRLLPSGPKRGDVVVFRNARDEGKDYIKRVIGLPGDRIKMLDAVL